MFERTEAVEAESGDVAVRRDAESSMRSASAS
jgi:hypothetical protein